MSKTLTEILSPQDSACVCNSYDVVGDIAIVRLTEKSRKHSEKIAEAIIAVHKNVKTVLAQASAVRGEFRLRSLEYVAGERKTRTVHRESGCLFSVDVDKCYFSPRLFYERIRIARLAEEGETVVNMFAGVGCFSIVMAKHAEVEKTYSIDINPDAVQQMRENIRVNRAYRRVVPMLGDAREVVEKRLRRVADRVLMPLPAKALEYLPYALLALREEGGWVHYYDFEHAAKDEDAVDKVRVKVSEKLLDICASFEIPFGRVVRATGPNWYQIVLDIKAKPSNACTWLG
ncbi:MAG: class I SAM-dependent methyltransferase family protein [Candidatus Bathyarchaeia archaeon]